MGRKPSPHPRACALSCPSLDICGPGLSGAPAFIYNACIVGRVVLYPSCTTRPSLCAPSALRGGSSGASMTIPGGVGTHAMSRSANRPRARRTGSYHGVGAPTRLPLGAPTLRFVPSLCPKPSLALTPAVLALCPLTQMVEGEFQAAGLARALVNRGGAMPSFTPEPRLCELCPIRVLGS